MALDAAFVAGNYREGLRILESGMPNQEPEWIELAINKLKALIAVQEGRTKEAIGFYRKVMDVIARDNKSQNDPSTGVQHSREMILGLHAKKIADLWASQKNEKEAAKAYQEARQYYEKALAAVEPESREAELIRRELAGIPKWRQRLLTEGAEGESVGVSSASNPFSNHAASGELLPI